MKLPGSQYVDGKTLVTIIVAAYVSALAYRFLPQATPDAVATKLAGK